MNLPENSPRQESAFDRWRPALLAFARVLADQRTPYAIICGLAVQVHNPEPRTTLDIAVISRDSIPREALKAAGFDFSAAFEHSENWVSTDGTPV